MEILTCVPLLLLYSFLFGFFTKVADLLDEYGLKPFHGADLLAGLLGGTFGIQSLKNY